MSKETKGVNIRLARKQYAELVTKKQKGEFLDQFCAATGMHRKSALRCFSQKERPHLKRGRPVTSGPAAKALLSRIWKLAGRPCSKLLKPMLRTWVDSLRDAGEVLDDGVVAELLGMSERTIDRRLSMSHPRHGGDPRAAVIAARPATATTSCDMREAMAMSELAQLQALFDKLYRPTMKMLEKTQDGCRCHRVFEKEPKTPARRVLESADAPEEAKEVVQMQLDGNDPMRLLGKIKAAKRRLRRIRARVDSEAGAVDGEDHV